MNSIKQKILSHLKQGCIQVVRNKSFEHFYQSKKAFDKGIFIKEKLSNIDVLFDKVLSKLKKKEFVSLLKELKIEIDEEKKMKQKFYKPIIKETNEYKESIDWISGKFSNFIESMNLKELADVEHKTREENKIKQIEEKKKQQKIKEEREMFANEIKIRTEQELNRVENEFVQDVAKWFAYEILTSEKMIVDHSDDPYWDHSGKVVSSGERYQLEDFHSFEDFLHEYNGSSYPSFQSRRGMNHLCYETNLDEMIREIVWEKYEDVVEKYLNENEEFEKWAIDFIGEETKIKGLSSEMVSEFAEDELDEFLAFEMETQLRESVTCKTVKELFEIGCQQLNKEEKQNVALNERYNAFMDKLKSMSGLKVIHIASYKEHPQMFELEGDELTSSYTVNGMSHYERFKSLFMDGLKNSVGITIRQYTGIHRIEQKGEEIKKHYVSNIYGVRTERNNWVSISADEMEKAHRTEPNGALMAKEPLVRYCVF